MRFSIARVLAFIAHPWLQLHSTEATMSEQTMNMVEVNCREDYRGHAGIGPIRSSCRRATRVTLAHPLR